MVQKYPGNKFREFEYISWSGLKGSGIPEQLQRAANRKMLSHLPDDITEILTEKRIDSFGNVFSCFEIFENLR